MSIATDTGSWEQYHLDLERRGDVLEWPDEFVIRFYKVDLRRIRAETVLEMGCGGGRHVSYLRSQGLQVVGTDIAKSAITLSQRRLEREGLTDGVELHVADATALPFPDARFDAVLAWRFLHVYPTEDAQRCVDEMHRLTRPGGRVLLGTRSPRSTNFELIQQGRGVDPDFNYAPGQLSRRALADSYYSREELEAMFRRFADVEIEHMEWTRKNGEFVEAYWSVTATRGPA